MDVEGFNSVTSGAHGLAQGQPNQYRVASSWASTMAPWVPNRLFMRGFFRVELAAEAQLYEVSLRFASAVREGSFQGKLAAELPRSTFWSCLVLLLGLLCYAVCTMVSPGDFAVGKAARAAAVQTGLVWFLCILCITLGGSARWTTLFHRLSPWRCELVVLTAILIMLPAGMALDRRYLAKMCEVDPQSSFGTGNGPSADAAIIAAGTIMFSHFCLPLRWCNVWIVSAWAMALHGSLGLLALLNDAEETFVEVLMSEGRLLAFVIFGAMGKRECEVLQRHHFACFVSEKTLRCTTEFCCEELARKCGSSLPTVLGVPVARPAGAAEADTRTAMSAPSTTWTGMIFEGLCQAKSTERMGAISRIFDLGQSEEWLLRKEDLEVNANIILGTGSFGVVVRGSLKGSPVAIKLVKSVGPKAERRHVSAMGNELRVLRKVEHPNIIKLHGAWMDPNQQSMALVLELIQGPSLEQLVQEPDALPNPADKCNVLCGISGALYYLHTRHPRIVHGDLKGSNVLMDTQSGTARAVLLDFGLSRVISSSARKLGGTPGWAAPELLLQGHCQPSPAADIFSFGCLIFLVLVGRPPMQDLSFERLRGEAKAGRVPALLWPDVEADEWTLKVQASAEQCLSFDPAERPRTKDMDRSLEALSKAFVVEAAAAAAADDGTFRERTSTSTPTQEAPTTPEDGSVQFMPAVAAATNATQTTPEFTQRLMLSAIMRAWNLGDPDAPQCCKYHAAVEELGRLHETMRQDECLEEYAVVDMEQCLQCFALSKRRDDDGGVKCWVCGCSSGESFHEVEQREQYVGQVEEPRAARHVMNL